MFECKFRPLPSMDSVVPAEYILPPHVPTRICLRLLNIMHLQYSMTYENGHWVQRFHSPGHTCTCCHCCKGVVGCVHSRCDDHRALGNSSHMCKVPAVWAPICHPDNWNGVSCPTHSTGFVPGSSPSNDGSRTNSWTFNVVSRSRSVRLDIHEHLQFVVGALLSQSVFVFR